MPKQIEKLLAREDARALALVASCAAQGTKLQGPHSQQKAGVLPLVGT